MGDVIKVEITQSIAVPMTPNFLKVGDNTVPVNSIPESALREVANKWRDALLVKAGYTVKGAPKSFEEMVHNGG